MVRNDIDDALWKKILALRDLADPDRGASQHEIEVATTKMQKLLLDHNLDLAMLDLGKPTTGVTHELFMTDEEAYDWELGLLKSLADHNFCRVIGDASRRVFAVIGKPLNIKGTWETYLWLRPRMVDLANEERDREAEKKAVTFLDYFDESADIARHHPLRWKQSYLFGMVMGIEKSLKKSRWESLDTKEKRAVVPVLDREVDDYLSQNFQVTKEKNYRNSDEDVFLKGQSAGYRMDIHKRDSLHE